MGQVADLFRQGGIFMWPLLFFSLLALTVIIERFIVLTKARINVNEFLTKIRKALDRASAGDTDSGDGRPSGRQMTDWFWHQTIAGSTIKDIMRGSADSADKQRKVLGAKSIVPGAYQ